jgi:WD40 repeat protein
MDFVELQKIRAGGMIGEFAWSPSSSHLALAASKSGLQVWEIESGERTAGIEDPLSVTRVAWSPDGVRLAAGYTSGEVRLVDARTGQRLQGVVGHEREISAIEYAPDGRWFASGGFDGMVRVWNSQDLSQRMAFVASDAAVNLAWSPGRDRLVTVGGGSAVKVWDPSTGQMQGELVGQSPLGAVVTCSVKGTYIAWGGMDRTISIWDVDRSDYLSVLSHMPHSITDLSFSPDEAYLAVYTEAKVHFVDLRAGEIVSVLPVASGYMNVSISPNGQYLASGAGMTDSVQVWAISA